MKAFFSRCPELAQAETRSVMVGTGGSLPADEYAFLEHYCEDLGCDCRRVFIEVVARSRPSQVLASINFGWEDEAFYRKRMSYDPEAPRQVIQGSLDPINTQSGLSEDLLKLFRIVAADAAYRLRLKRHYQKFKETLKPSAR